MSRARDTYCSAMDHEERVRLVEGLAAGTTTFRSLTGLGQKELDAMSRLGRVAFESGRFDHAAAIFAGLEALEADRPEHSLRRAHAELAAGRREEAIGAVTRYLEHDTQVPAADSVRALLFRATLLMDQDRRGATLDVMAARLLAEESPAAKAALEAGAL